MDQRVSTLELAREPAAPVEITTELPPGAFRALVGLYALMIGAFVAAFRRDGETLFQIAVCIVYGVMYFGVPALLLGMRPASGARRPYFMTVPKIDTFTGPLTQRDALAQILSVPATLAFGAIALAFIIMNARG